ncbi:ABC transporter permease [Actinoplanes sp. NPDC051343]|uniref:ABC transporter permease n=1 Tax=Actinoplanes sp. NPDC051343 TaxID=3363906 RepID=UPI003791E7A5
MAYDDETPSDPAAYRANTLAATEQRRRAAEMMDETTADAAGGAAAAEFEDDGRDRLGVHLGWEVVLLVAAAVFAFLLYRLDPSTLKRPALDTLLVAGAAIGLLAMGAGLSLRAAVPNLAIGPIALAASLQYAEQGDQGLVKGMLPAVLIAAAGGLVIGVVILALHVPGWVATLAAGLGVVVFDQLRAAPVALQGQYDPTKQAFFLFGGFALLAVIGGALGTITPVRRWLGRMRPAGDPAYRRGGTAAVPVLGSLVLSSVFAVGAGTLFAAQATRPIVPGTGLEWTGIGVGLALLAGTSAYGRRGGIFGTLFAVAGLTLFLDYSDRKHYDISLFAIAACVLGGGLIVTRLVETYGRPFGAGAGADWNSPPTTNGSNWTPDLPENWTPTTTAARSETWDDGPWGSSR